MKYPNADIALRKQFVNLMYVVISFLRRQTDPSPALMVNNWSPLDLQTSQLCEEQSNTKALLCYAFVGRAKVSRL